MSTMNNRFHCKWMATVNRLDEPAIEISHCSEDGREWLTIEQEEAGELISVSLNQLPELITRLRFLQTYYGVGDQIHVHHSDAQFPFVPAPLTVVPGSMELDVVDDEEDY